MIKTPFPAPDFHLKDEAGSDFSLHALRGSWVIVYFYPKDDTPGCTIEACSLRDVRDDLADLGTRVVGISQDDAESHEKFKAKHSLNFTLLSDPERTVINSYGAWGKKQFGKEGILRKTFIIDPAGNVVKEYRRVTPLQHGASVLETLKKLQQVA